jgi:outer membrane receptor protein involved in Fe transport
MNVMASYTFTNSDRNVAGVGLLPEFVIPRHLFSVSLSQSFRRLQISTEVNRTGSYIAPVFENDFPFRAANLKFDGYTKVDLFGSYRRPIGERLEAVFFAGAENLFNQLYFENGFRAPGIVGKGGLKLEF